MFQIGEHVVFKRNAVSEDDNRLKHMYEIVDVDPGDHGREATYHLCISGDDPRRGSVLKTYVSEYMLEPAATSAHVENIVFEPKEDCLDPMETFVLEELTKASEENTVNHPRHYNMHPSGIECIEIARHHNFNIGNAIKYLWRMGLKHTSPVVEDLRKAIWYLNDELERLENE